MGNIYDIVCAGFGPAAIAFAAAVEDEIRSGKLPSNYRSKIIFLEKAAETKWQGGLLLPGTNINHNYLRDLATPRFSEQVHNVPEPDIRYRYTFP